MTHGKAIWLGLSALAALSAAPSVGAYSGGARSATVGCIATTIDELSRNPQRFEGRRICVSGFLGQMVPYGEDSPKLYATREEAEATQLERYLTIGIPFTISTQERLSHHSTQSLNVSGFFRLEGQCASPVWRAQHAQDCAPPPFMGIARARLTFSDGARFR